MDLDIRKVQLLLTEKGWNQTRLAEALGVSKQWVDQVLVEHESDGTSHRLATIEKLARALGCSPKDILTD